MLVLSITVVLVLVWVINLGRDLSKVNRRVVELERRKK